MGQLSFKLISNFRVEPYLFIILLSLSIKSVTETQIIQDKICIYVKEQSVSFCERLSKVGDNPKDTDSEIQMKSEVLVLSSKFQMYTMAVAFLPSLLICLYLGSWCDNFISGKKILMLFGASGMALECLIKIYMCIRFDLDYKYFLLGSLPSGLGGGIFTCYAAILSYVPSTTPQHLRPIRFMLIEICYSVAHPVATTLGGFLLNTPKTYNWTPIGKHGQLLNYSLVYIVGFIFSVLAILWVIFFVDETRDKEQLDKFDLNKTHHELYQPNNGAPRPLPRSISERPKKNIFLALFDCGNLIDVIKTCFKPRKNRARLQLCLIIVSIVIFLLAHIGPMIIMFPFAQKVYLWDSEKYSYIGSAAFFVNSIGTFFITILLTKVFNVKDITLAIIGISSVIVSSVLRGSIQNPYGFYSGAVIGSIGAITNVGMRSHLSKIVGKTELGKVFSMIAALDGAAPLLANIFFALIFTKTLDVFPGAVFEATAAMLFIPLFIMFWIDINCNKSSDTIDYNNDNRTKQRSDNLKNHNQPKHRRDKFNNRNQPKRYSDKLDNIVQNEVLSYRTTHSTAKTLKTTEL